MPEHPFGKSLSDLAGEPPRPLDVTRLLAHARRRTRQQRLLVGLSAAAVATVAVVLVSSLSGTSSTTPTAPTSPPPKTTPPTTSASPTTPVQTPPTVAPDVRGQSVDTAITTLTQANCESGVSSVVNDPAPVGQVIAQLRTAAAEVCTIALTVSAGPTTNAPACSSLQVTNGNLTAGLGNAAFVIHLRNTGRTLCTLAGYPQLTGTDSTGTAVVAQHTPNGYTGGLSLSGPLPTLRLRPGEQVSALAEGTDNPTGNATSCPDLNRLRLTVAGHTYPLTASLSNCSGLQIHPLVPSTTGSLQPDPSPQAPPASVYPCDPNRPSGAPCAPTDAPTPSPRSS